MKFIINTMLFAVLLLLFAFVGFPIFVSVFGLIWTVLAFLGTVAAIVFTLIIFVVGVRLIFEFAFGD